MSKYQAGIGYNPTNRPDGFDWDRFWAFTSKQEGFNRLLYAVHFRHYIRLLKGILPPNPRILELGAGSGIVARRIAQRWGGRLTLIDANKAACERYKSLRQPHEPIDYVQGDVFSVSFPPVFDLVYSDGLIEHFPNKDAVFAAHLRALNSTGYLLLFVPNNSLFFRTLTKFGPDFGYEERYTLSALITLCGNYGLSVLRQTQYPFAVGVLCQRQ